MNNNLNDLLPIGNQNRNNQQGHPVKIMSESKAKANVKAILAHLDGARVLILELFEQRGWEALGYKSWAECVVAEFDQSHSYLHRQLKAAQAERVIAPDQPIGTIPEGSLRPLIGLPPEKQVQAYSKAVEQSPKGKPTAAQVKAAVDEVAPKPPAKPKASKGSSGSSSKPLATAPAKPPEPQVPLRPDPETLAAGIEGWTAPEPFQSPIPIDPPDIASQRAAGIIPAGVEVLVEEPSPSEAELDEPADESAYLTDAEYLESCLIRPKLVLSCRKVFDRDALLFRSLTVHRKKFHHHAKRALNANRRQGRTGMYHFYVSTFLRNEHPQHWLLCGDCKGSGQVVTIGECPTCHGMGYKVR